MKKILLIFGGNSSEHEVSCLSAASILKNIDKKKFEISSVGISKNNEWFLFDSNIEFLENKKWLDVSKNNKINNIVFFLKQFDIVFPIIHGSNGEDGKLQGLLDLFNIKYVGSKTLSSALCMDKMFCKIIFSYLNIPQVPYFITDKKYDNIKQDIKYPVIVKPSNGGSSIGINVAHNLKQLKKAIKIACKHDKKVIVEKFIIARELECSILKENKLHVSTVGEIVSSNIFYDYEAKYKKGDSKLIIPANVPKNIEENIKEYAKIIFSTLECDNLARIDFFYDEQNDNIYINEINTLPGFTNISMYSKLLEYDGIHFKDIITKLIENA